MSLIDRVAETLVGHRRLILMVMLVLTLVVGSGASMIESSSSIDSIAADTDEVNKNQYVQDNFSSRDENTTTALFAVRNRDGNVLSRESLIRSLKFQQQLRENESVGDKLAEERPTLGIANIVARNAMLREYRIQQRQQNASAANASAAEPPTDPTIEEQIEQLESMDDSEVEALVGPLLAEDSELPGHQAALEFLPRDYEVGSTEAESRMVVVSFHTKKEIREPGTISDEVVAGHVDARDIAKSQSGPETYLAFGAGFIPEQLSNAISDSFAIIGPLALVFVVVVLSIAYRDLLDIVLGLVGVFLVLVWTFGLMGWTGIPFNQVMIAVPILLIGLSVDYSLHVIMRYREERERNKEAGVREAMVEGLSGVGIALTLVTVTTAIGFLANLTSPVGDMQDFGMLTAVGISSTLVVFGVIIPALKVEIDGFFENRGFDRSKQAFGTSKRLGGLLSLGSTVAKRMPLAILALALVVSAAGAYGAAGIDSEFSEEAVMADEPPEWTEQFPESRQPGEFYLKENREFILANFQSPDKQVHLLVEGDITQSDTLERVADANTQASNANVTFVRSGDAVVKTPLTAMERIADRNETFNETLAAADTDGDGVPNQNIKGVYDAFYAASPELAEQYIHRTDDGTYAAARMEVAVKGGADPTAIHEETREIASDIETGNDDLSAIATGQPIVSKQSDQLLANAVVEGLVVTLVALIVVLSVTFRVVEGKASIGVVTIIPVIFSVLWLLGTMSLLEIPFTFTTSVVGSIALGLGVDYTIHVSERFIQELEASGESAIALEKTVRGTGGALLSSAATTSVGFGVLGFTLLPALQRFGLILALGVIYAFLASVFVLPSLLALWASRSSVAPTSDPSPEPAGSSD